MTVYFVGGSKGGVGKTMTCLALADYLMTLNRTFSIVDADESNPDFYKPFAKLATPPPMLAKPLHDDNGWLELIDFIHKQAGDVIINSAAGSMPTLLKHGKMFEGAIAEMDQEIVVLWPINRQRDSLEALLQFTQSFAWRTHVLKNCFFGDASKFVLFDESKIKAALEAKGWKSIIFPELADRVADQLYTDRLTLEAANDAMFIANRHALARWREDIYENFSEIIK